VVNEKGTTLCYLEQPEPCVLSLGSLSSGPAAVVRGALSASLRVNPWLPEKHAFAMRTAKLGSVIATSVRFSTASEDMAASALLALIWASLTQGLRTVDAVAGTFAAKGGVGPVYQMQNASPISA
jgi:hypothetical protein